MLTCVQRMLRCPKGRAPWLTGRYLVCLHPGEMISCAAPGTSSPHRLEPLRGEVPLAAVDVQAPGLAVAAPEAAARMRPGEDTAAQVEDGDAPAGQLPGQLAAAVTDGAVADQHAV